MAKDAKGFDAGTKAKEGMTKMPAGPAKTPIDGSYRHGSHGKDGSHQSSHKKLGGSRAKIVTGSPEEQ